MGVIDWTIIALFTPVILAPLLTTAKPASTTVADRFAAGRRIPWFVLGGSLAATSLSTDTPLLVAGAFYGGGLSGNWFWLAGVPGALATLFFFARYWRRSGVLTKVEILSLRYGDGAPTRWLRAATAVFDAGVVNVLVLASVTYASHILVEELLGLSGDPTFRIGPFLASEASLLTVAVMALTVAYTMAAGFRAVVQTDIAQLTAAVVASVFVAYFAVRAGARDHGGYARLIEALPDADSLFSLFRPDDASIWLLLAFGWWQTAPGSGLFVQRLVSARSESDAALTALFFALLHYVARMWPWLAIGALALIYFPGLDDNEVAYALVADRFLPAGGAGLMTVAFWSAFMSTVDSRLNWGASYFVNDVYGAFGRDRNGAGARIVEAAAIVAMAALALAIALTGLLTSIIGVYKYLIVIQAGAAFAAIARWYWWRLTIWAEIAALGSSVVVGNVLALTFDMSANSGFALVMTINSVACGALTVATAYLTSRAGPTDPCRAFARKVRVGGPGWRAVDREREGAGGPPLWKTVALWLLSIIVIYGCISLAAAVATMNARAIALTGASVVSAGVLIWFLRASLFRMLEASPTP